MEKLLNRYPELCACRESIETLTAAMLELYRAGGTLFCCGNGGSAADCDHICGELLKGFLSKRPLKEEERKNFARHFGSEGEELAAKLQGGLPAVSLLSHPALLSAFANDADPDLGFAQQVYAQGRPGDLLLGISTGGGALNVRCALMAARAKGMKTALLTGNRHGICESYADIVVAVPESETFRIQELHLPIYHYLCAAVEAEMFPEA